MHTRTMGSKRDALLISSKFAYRESENEEKANAECKLAASMVKIIVINNAALGAMPDAISLSVPPDKVEH